MRERSCRSEGSSVPSSSTEPLIRFVGRKSAVRKPRSAQSAEMLAVSVDLPTPPLVETDETVYALF